MARPKAALTFSKTFVSAVRSTARKRAAQSADGAPRKPGRPAGSLSKPVSKRAVIVDRAIPAASRSLETTFRKLVVELGVHRARQLLSEVETELDALVAGL